MDQTTTFDFMQGEVLLIDKPLKWTSFDVVNKVRWLIKSKLKITTKVGHAGTLDPLASGLLILCTGKLTKQINTYQDQEKEYTGTFYLGATTPSFDLETEVNEQFPIHSISEQNILEATSQFTGTIQQVPPLFSAKRILGERAYEKARRGETMEIQAREVTIKEFEITSIQLPEIHFRVVCTKGTYIRSLARDFGKALGNGAYLKALCRTRIGEFNLKNAMEMDAFESLIYPQEA